MIVRKPRYPKPKLKRLDSRWHSESAVIHQNHLCEVCSSDRACYSYDFGKTWYCAEHRIEKGQ